MKRRKRRKGEKFKPSYCTESTRQGMFTNFLMS